MQEDENKEQAKNITVKLKIKKLTQAQSKFEQFTENKKKSHLMRVIF